jgi:hypothetical protein
MAEEIFFYQYNLHMDYKNCMMLPINLRKWMISRFIKQKEDEHAEAEKERRRAKRK